MSRSALQLPSISGAPFKVAIAAASYNEKLVDALLAQASAFLRAAGVKDRNLTIVRVPGSNELPFAAQLLAESRRPDAILALGVLVRGDTIHYEVIADSVAIALHRVALDCRRPVVNGVIVAENEAQAASRCLGRLERGTELARTTLAMAALRKELSR